MDLFITGTDILGKISKEFDNTGKLIEIKDHRVVFHLQHRQDRPEDKYTPFKQDESTSQALAKLCRITSCFPLAFPVVTIKLKSDNPVDQKLVEWGQLEDRELPANPPKDTGYQLHFVDGGVLDNRPFSYTIETIYYRSAYRPVSRKLLYIDPSPERFLGSPEFEQMAKPNIWETVKDSLISLPRYESIGKDLERIREGNRKIRRYNNLQQAITQDLQYIESLKKETGSGNQVLIFVSSILIQIGLHRLAFLLLKEYQEIIDQETLERNRYLQCRFFGILDGILPLVFTIDTQSKRDRQEREKLLEKAATLLIKYITDVEELEKRVKLVDGIAKNIQDLDVQYAMRKHGFILNEIGLILEKNQGNNNNNELVYLAYQLTWQIEILKIIQEGLEEVLKSFSERFYQIIDRPTNDGIVEDIFKNLVLIHRDLLNSANYKDIYIKWQKQLRTITVSEFREAISGEQTLIDNLFDSLMKIFQGIKIKGNTLITSKLETLNNSKDYRSILQDIEETSNQLIKDININLAKKFQLFKQIDQNLYSYEYLTDIQTKDLIEIVRISPDNAQLGFGKDKGIDEKLAGDQLRAFGGFFKKSWRANDILWGRLDGLNQIVETLVNKESVEKGFRGFLAHQQTLINNQFAGNKEDYLKTLVKESFPSIDMEDEEKDTNSLLIYLKRLANGEIFKDTDFQDFINKLVEAGQREIINTDLRNVITDAIQEQLEWNQQKIKSKSEKQKPQYKPVGGYFDKIVTPLMAKELAQDSLSKLTTENFFLNEYRVGSEKLLEDVPANILQGLGAKAGLNLRDILVSWQGDKLTNNLVYTIVNNFLLAFHALVNFQGIPLLSFLQVKIVLTIILTIILIFSLTAIVKNSLLWVIVALVTLFLLFLPKILPQIELPLPAKIFSRLRSFIIVSGFILLGICLGILRNSLLKLKILPKISSIFQEIAQALPMNWVITALIALIVIVIFMLIDVRGKRQQATGNRQQGIKDTAK